MTFRDLLGFARGATAPVVHAPPAVTKRRSEADSGSDGRQEDTRIAGCVYRKKSDSFEE
jgi:hypothetical protein